MATTAASRVQKKPEIPSAYDWRTTDSEEILKRRMRAKEESFAISNTAPSQPVFSNFRVKSGSGLTYGVEVRSVQDRHFSCDCVDFRINGLGTCKHVEAVLLQLEARHKRLFKSAASAASPRIDLVVDPSALTLRVPNRLNELPRAVRRWFTSDGILSGQTQEEALLAFQNLSAADYPHVRISQDIEPWLESQRRLEQTKALRREYELKVQQGFWPVQETRVPLFPYQREGMLHLAFTERALLADEMGLGKTIQAIAACALLHRLGNVKRVLVVSPASLKSEWEEQIARFTSLNFQIVYGGKPSRLMRYSMGAETPFFTLVNYEQMLTDALDINQHLQPDVVVLDEAQRIKNWSTKTAQAVKRLQSRYAFVLTGTPIENRIDELHSLMDFLNPSVLGPLFRFNRTFYKLDERGRPEGYRNLDILHQRIRPFMLRRRKIEVETELPQRTDRNHFVPLSDLQRQEYAPHAQIVMRLGQIAKRRPLSKQELEKLMRELAMMRMTCDTNFILNPQDRACPKLAELETVLSDSRDNDTKVIVFSEWERMLMLVRDLCKEMEIGFAWHTGSVPQKRRRAEINSFKDDPACRVFLSTDSGATGLNLQVANVVVNCDLPWNPAKLEQRIARAWRKNQTRPVTVINLISENTIEHRMLETLATKQTLADSVLDQAGKIKEISLRAGRQSFVERLQQLVTPTDSLPKNPIPTDASPTPRRLPTDRSLAFAQLAVESLNGQILRCEERFPNAGAHSVVLVVVERNAEDLRSKLSALHEECLGRGKVDPLAPSTLEVMDRATHEALERLISAGVVARTTRAHRDLLPTQDNTEHTPLSPEEEAKARHFREQSNRQLKMAQLLGAGGFVAEARPLLLEAALSLGRAMAVESRMPEPSDLQDLVRPPLSHGFGEALQPLKVYIEQSTTDWKLMMQCLVQLLADKAAHAVSI